MSGFKDVIRRLIEGEDINDVINSLFESVTPAHQALGRLKKNLRDLVSLGKRKFRTTIIGTPTPSQLMAADGADKLLKNLTEYFLKKRASIVGELETTGGFKAKLFTGMCDEVHTLANGLVNANTNNTIIQTAIKASEAAGELKGMV
jgi:hypothetical protein